VYITSQCSRLYITVAVMINTTVHSEIPSWDLTHQYRPLRPMFCVKFLGTDGVLASGKLSASRQKSSVLVTSTTTMSQLLKSLFGGVYDSRVNFGNITYDDLGVWTPDWVHTFCCTFVL